MKIDLIGQALDEIKEEDQNNLKELEDKVNDIESVYFSKKKEIVRLKGEYARLEKLDDMRKSFFKRLHMIMPVFEIPIGLVLSAAAVHVMLPIIPTIIAFATAVVCEFDAFKTLFDDYPKIIGRDNYDMKAYISAFKELFLSKHDLRLAMINTYNELLNANDDAFEILRELEDTKEKKETVRRELLHLEGYISSIEYIVQKQYFEELSDTCDIVEFINEKRELKKAVNQ